jgi:hypothetical protein
MNSRETSPASTQKSGGITLAFAIIFLLLLAYPIAGVIMRDYESDMTMAAIYLGGPCLFLGTLSGLVGLARGHRRCRMALGLMWIPVIALFVVSITLSVLNHAK